MTRTEYLDRTGIQMYQRDVFGDPLINISFGSYGIGGATGEVIGDKIWQSRGNLTPIRGKHSLRTGGQYHYRKFFTDTANPMNGDAVFSGAITGFPMADASFYLDIMCTLALNEHHFAETNKIRAAQNSAAPKTERTT